MIAGTAPHISNEFHAPRCCRGFKGAFTLVELLAVIAIIGIVTSLAIVSLGGVSTSRQVATAASRVSDSAELARQNAISTGSPTRLAVAINWPGQPEKNYRTFVIAGRQETGGTLSWAPLRRWDELPSGVSFREDASGTGMSILANPNDPGSPSMTISGPSGNISAKYIEFLPSGQVRPEFPGGASLILARGEPTEPKGDNWVEIHAHPVTGKVTYRQP